MTHWNQVAAAVMRTAVLQVTMICYTAAPAQATSLLPAKALLTVCLSVPAQAGTTRPLTSLTLHSTVIGDY